MPNASPDLHHTLAEDGLATREAERDLYRNLLRAETAIKANVAARARARSAVISLASHQRIGQESADAIAWRENDSRWSGPRIPRRASIKVGRRSLFERLVDYLTRPRLALRERFSLVWSRVRASIQRRSA